MYDDEESDNRKFNTLKNEELWFSTIKKLNDPYEFKFLYIDEEKLIKQNRSEVLDIFKKLFNQISTNWGLTSLSGNSYNYLPMWAYYTNNYHGYCVEYDVLRPDTVFKVEYEPKRYPVANTLIAYYSEVMRSLLSEEDDMSQLEELYGMILRYNLIAKHDSWQHENEYRILSPIEEIKYGKAVPLSAIYLKTSRIIVGYNCKPEHIERLNSISQEIGCGQISKVELSETEYTLLG